MSKYGDPYGVTWRERLIDEFVGFWGALLGVKPILERPLHSTSGRDLTPADYSTSSESASAWRRERNYQRARADLIANDLDKVPCDIRDCALGLFTQDRYIDWLLKIEPSLGGRRPIDLIRVGDFCAVRDLLKRSPAERKPRCAHRVRISGSSPLERIFYEVVSYFGGLLGIDVYLDDPQHAADARGRSRVHL